MRNRYRIIIILLIVVPCSIWAMQEVRSFKAGPLHLINKSGQPLEIEVRLAKNYGTPAQRQLLQPNQSLTVSSLTLISDAQQGKNAIQAQREGAYEIFIHLPKKFNTNEPLKFPLALALDKIQECTRSKKQQEISALVSISPKSGLGLTGIYSYYVLDVTFTCGNYEPKLEKEWQVIDALGGIKETEINLGDTAMQPMLFEDIVALHPGWKETHAREFYNSLIASSGQEAKQFDQDFQNFRSKIPRDDNDLQQKFKKVVELAKRNNFLSPGASIENNKASDGTSTVVFDFNDGYIHFISSAYLKGPINERRLRTYATIETSPAIFKTIAYDLAKAYKVHLMPKNDWGSLLAVTNRLLALIVQDPELQKIVSEFKIRLAPLLAGPANNKVIMPIVVIYTFGGKEDAQKLLGKIYHGLKDLPGLGIPPRYNASINDLIYVAQGSGEDKGGKFAHYYEQPRQIYYRADITGSNTDYHLKNPATGAELQ